MKFMAGSLKRDLIYPLYNLASIRWDLGTSLLHKSKAVAVWQSKRLLILSVTQLSHCSLSKTTLSLP